MKKSINSRIVIRLWSVDCFAILLAVATTSFVALRFEEPERLPFMGRGAVVTPVLALLIWVVVLVANDAYRIELSIAGTEYYERVMRSGLYASGILAVVGFVFDIQAVRPFILFGYPIGLVIHLALRWAARQSIRQILREDDVSWQIIVVTGRNEGAPPVDWSAARHPQVEVVRFFKNPHVTAVIEALNQGSVDAAYVSADAALSADELRELGWAAEYHRTALWLEPATSLMTQGRISFVPFGFVDVMTVRTVHLTPFQSLIKRIFDLFVGLSLVIILVPVFIVVVFVIAIVEGFPIFYSQSRVGRNGEKFRMFKFRTMVGEPSSDDLQFDEHRRYVSGTKMGTSQSFTRSGKFLRRWSIDEIPQLMHVLTGTMSLVGPRPRLAHELLDLPVTSRRMLARPGLTGLWQVSGRADLSFAEADALDVAYVDRWSLIGDIAILIRTIKAVLTQSGAR